MVPGWAYQVEAHEWTLWLLKLYKRIGTEGPHQNRDKDNKDSKVGHPGMEASEKVVGTAWEGDKEI